MADKATQLTELLAPTVEALGLELLGIEYLTAPGGALVRIYIDVPADAETGQADPEGEGGQGVTIEHCEAVSREVSAQLDVEDPISGNYTLEVSSPGLERPLFGAAQFARFVGETAKVVLRLPQEGRRRLQGAILRVDGQALVFDVDGAEFVVDAANVEKAKLVPDWVALGLAPAVDKSGRDLRPGKQKKNRSDKKKPAGNSAAGEPSNTQSAAEQSPDAE